jgi:hypothetical protein
MCCLLRYDDKLNEGMGASFQAALLYTTTSGQRLIRVHTLMLGVGNQVIMATPCKRPCISMS